MSNIPDWKYQLSLALPEDVSDELLSKILDVVELLIPSPPDREAGQEGEITTTSLSGIEKRLLDLVRYSRHALHDENLITDDEFAALVSEGAESARRLESYDELRTKLDAAAPKPLPALAGYIYSASVAAFVVQAHNKIIPRLLSLVRQQGDGECTWTVDSDEFGERWIPSCGGDPWEFEAGGPREHKVKFCYHCGNAVLLPPEGKE